MLVQGNVGRVKKLGVVVGRSGRGFGVVRTSLSEIITLRDTLRLVTLPLVIPNYKWVGLRKLKAKKLFVEM
jgi:hypothetical protein